MNRFSAAILMFVGLLAGFFASGCGSTTPPPISVTLSPSGSPAIDQGQTLSISATVANDSSGKGGHLDCLRGRLSKRHYWQPSDIYRAHFGREDHGDGDCHVGGRHHQVVLGQHRRQPAAFDLSPIASRRRCECGL